MALTSNTTEGLNLVVNGLDLAAGRRGPDVQPRAPRPHRPLEAQGESGRASASRRSPSARRPARSTRSSAPSPRPSAPRPRSSA
ncbi:MAG: hypothetical protein MZV64_18370 [Ignavibacteriales bacterium]|nr:hypothetical protein [Ignavibacteriales bacterium]